MLINISLLNDVKNIITNAREKAIRAVDTERADVLAHWQSDF